MTDITSTHLEAAVIDQVVAGIYGDRPYAFSAVIGDGGWMLGVTVANEPGYNPVVGKVFKDQAEAKTWADGLNTHIGLSSETVTRIIISTMGGQAFNPALQRWA